MKTLLALLATGAATAAVVTALNRREWQASLRRIEAFGTAKIQESYDKGFLAAKLDSASRQDPKTVEDIFRLGWQTGQQHPSVDVEGFKMAVLADDSPSVKVRIATTAAEFDAVVGLNGEAADRA